MLHHKVGDNDIGYGVSSPSHAFFDTEGGLHGVAVLLKKKSLALKKIRIVIDNEYSRHWHPP
jgi:hypothetical protein